MGSTVDEVCLYLGSEGKTKKRLTTELEEEENFFRRKSEVVAVRSYSGQTCRTFAPFR